MVLVGCDEALPVLSSHVRAAERECLHAGARYDIPLRYLAAAPEPADVDVSPMEQLLCRGLSYVSTRQGHEVPHSRSSPKHRHRDHRSHYVRGDGVMGRKFWVSRPSRA